MQSFMQQLEEETQAAGRLAEDIRQIQAGPRTIIQIQKERLAALDAEHEQLESDILQLREAIDACQQPEDRQAAEEYYEEQRRLVEEIAFTDKQIENLQSKISVVLKVGLNK